MPWFKVDDRFYSHLKVHSLSMAARGLWVTAGSWCASQLTDGFVPRKMVVVLGARQRDAEALVAAGMWSEVEGGYAFNSWLDYQPSKEEWEAKRQGNAARVAAHRAKKSPESRQDSSKILPKSRQNPSKGLAEVWQPESSDNAELASDVTHYTSVSNALPTRPDPTREEEAVASSPVVPSHDVTSASRIVTAVPRRVVSPAAESGMQWYADLIGQFREAIPSFASNVQHYEFFGAQSREDRDTVAKNLRESRAHGAKLKALSPKFIAESLWQSHLLSEQEHAARKAQYGKQPAAAPAQITHQLMKY